MMQTCSKCGVTLFVFGDETPGMCRRCRVASGDLIDDTGAPFQRVGTKRRRSLVSIRAAGLVFALVIVLATLSSIRDRPASARVDTPSPASSASPSGGVIILLAPPASGSAPSGDK